MGDRPHEQCRDRRKDRRDRDVPYSLEVTCTVNGCSFIKRRVDIGHGCKVEDSSPTETLPNTGCYEDRGEPLCFRDEADLITADRSEEVIDRAGCGNDFLDHTAKDNYRYEVRQIGYCLNELLPVKISDLVNEKSKDQCERESESKIRDIQCQRILKSSPECLVRNELLKILNTYKLVTEDITACTILTKCNNVTDHRYISEYYVIDDRDDQHRVKLPVATDMLLDAALFVGLAKITLNVTTHKHTS